MTIVPPDRVSRTQLMVAEEGLELHSLSPGLKLTPSVLLLSHWLKTKIFVSIYGTVGIQPKYALCLSCDSMTTLPGGKLAAPLGTAGHIALHKIRVSPPECHSSCKSRENPNIRLMIKNETRETLLTLAFSANTPFHQE